MTTQEALEQFKLDELTFDIEETFRNGEYYFSIADPFNSKEDAEKFMETLKNALLKFNKVINKSVCPKCGTGEENHKRMGNHVLCCECDYEWNW